MEATFLSLEALRKKFPGAPKAFLPLEGPYPYIFVATETTAFVSDIRAHLPLALAALPPFPMDLTSLLRQAADMNTRHEVVGHVRPKIKVAGVIDAKGIIRSYGCPSLDVFFNEHDRAVQDYVSNLRAALFAFCDPRQIRHTA